MTTFFDEMFSMASNYTMMGISLVTVIVLVLGVVYYLYFYRKALKREGLQTTGDGDAELLFFYTDWCPHCKTAKPEWESAKSEMDGKTINKYTIRFKDVNCTEESAEVENLTKTYKIEGYPTIKLIKNGEVIEYDSKPNKDTLVEFLNTVL